MTKLLSKPVYKVLVAVVLLAAFLVGFLLVRNRMDPLDCRMAPGVTIGGLQVEGMTRGEARKAVRAAAKETVCQQALTVSLPSQELAVDPSEAGIRVSVWKAVGDAYRVGRSVSAQETALALSPYLKYDPKYLRSLLEAYKAQYDTVLTQPSWKVRGQVPELGTDVYDPEAPGQTIELTLGLPERHMDVDAAMAQLLEGYSQGLAVLAPHTVEVPAAKEPDAPNLEEIYNTTLIKPKDDGTDLEAGTIKHGSFGYHFDKTKAQEMIAAADYGQTISIPMEAYAPEIYGEAVYFRDVLGTCETRHTDDENRNANLALVCQFLNGVVIQPGEEFSYNQTVGERSPERGFKPATVFAGNRMAKDYGGGVCQGSTTLYNCLLLADMEVTERHGHGAKVTYVPLGLDAAVNWLTETDLQFRNNSHFPVKIQAELADGYMKMQLLGTDEKDYYIKMEANQYEEGGFIYAGSYKLKFDKETDEQLSRDRVAFSTYDLSITG